MKLNRDFAPIGRVYTFPGSLNRFKTDKRHIYIYREAWKTDFHFTNNAMLRLKYKF